jgi:hypothetical protein
MAETKYHSKKVTIGDITFDSKIEAKYYEQLKWLEANKQILFFRIQPRYLLQEAFEKDGCKIRKIDYLGDFEVHHLDGSIEVIDTKGAPPTEAFKIKKKLFEKRYPHKLSIIGYSKMDGGWLDYYKLEKLRKLRKAVKAVDKASGRNKGENNGS